MLNTCSGVLAFRRYSSWLVRASAGELGGVPGPVTSGLVHPLGRGCLMQAEQVGREREGQLGGKAEARGPPVWA
jgi:hypothetical protein